MHPIDLTKFTDIQTNIVIDYRWDLAKSLTNALQSLSTSERTLLTLEYIESRDNNGQISAVLVSGKPIEPISSTIIQEIT